MELFGSTASRIRPALESYCFNKVSSGVAGGRCFWRIDELESMGDIGGMGFGLREKPGAIVASRLVIAHRGVR